MDKDGERRHVPRIEANWPVTVFMDGEEIEGESRNISSEGMLICCDKPLPLNNALRISIRPPGHQAIGVTGKIIWSDFYGIDKDKNIFGVGISLVEISEDDHAPLEEMISYYI